MAEASAKKNGTFNSGNYATPSGEVTGTAFDIILKAAGTCSIDIEVKLPDNTFLKSPGSSQITMPATASTIICMEFLTTQTIRLTNNTSPSADVVWSISAA